MRPAGRQFDMPAIDQKLLAKSAIFTAPVKNIDNLIDSNLNPNWTGSRKEM